MAQAVTLELPDDAYRRAERYAAAVHADIQRVLLDVIDQGLPQDGESAAMDELAALTESELEARARGSFDAGKLAEFDRLCRKQEQGPLGPAEQSRLDALRRAYQHAQIDMARAMAVLALRRRVGRMSPR